MKNRQNRFRKILKWTVIPDSQSANSNPASEEDFPASDKTQLENLK